MLGTKYLPQLIDHGLCQDEKPFIIQEVYGLDLAKLADQGPLFLDFVLKVGHNLITAVENFHNLGFLHCDIKPDNFLLDKNNFATQRHMPEFG